MKVLYTVCILVYQGSDIRKWQATLKYLEQYKNITENRVV